MGEKKEVDAAMLLVFPAADFGIHAASIFRTAGMDSAGEC
jgi:hypothetical protein